MQQQAPTPTNKLAAASVANEDAGRQIGIGILAVVVLVAAIWLQVQGKRALQATAAPPTPLTVELPRFNAAAYYLPNDALLGFVEIPAGPFVMGSNPAVDAMAFANERWSDDLKQGTVNLPTFYIGRYEVTVAQFQAFAAATQYRSETLALAGAPDHPAVNVSWTDALAYSRWLEAQLIQSPGTPAPLLQRLRDGWHVSIPNEAQWEKAARGTDGRIYPWGNAADRKLANFASGHSAPVGSYVCAPCAYGLADMSGNAWELTRSNYRPYPFSATDIANLQAPALYVMRGGSFNDPDTNVRAALRGGIDPGARRPFVGFRIVITPD